MTDAGELADLAAAGGYDHAHFAEGLDSTAMREATRTDFATAKSLGVAGFPTLALGVGRELFLVASGFAPADVLEARIAEIGRRVQAERA